MKKLIFRGVCYIVFQLFLFIQPVFSQDYALSFDGVDDMIFINKYEKLNLGTNDFTIEALVNLQQKPRDLHSLLTNSQLSGGGTYLELIV
jgi:hypothetical protein